jgi:hypothetical protein
MGGHACWIDIGSVPDPIAEADRKVDVNARYMQAAKRILHEKVENRLFDEF